VRDDGLVKVFGFKHPDLERIDLPVNTNCFHCEEPIRQGEPGFSMMHVGNLSASRVYEHRACFLRGIFGSVAHIEHRCSCFVPGSECGDPGGLTRRQAAEAAVRAYERHYGRNRS
jgi:hypothetical protein